MVLIVKGRVMFVFFWMEVSMGLVGTEGCPIKNIAKLRSFLLIGSKDGVEFLEV